MLKAFVSYAHQDSAYRRDLDTNLKVLRHQALLTGWSDREIKAGEDWAGQIDHALAQSQIILLLISPDFIASDYAYSKEMTEALRRHDAGSAVVIPVILRTCHWQRLPFGKLQATPSGGRPIRRFGDRDAAYSEVVTDIEKAALKLLLIEDGLPIGGEAIAETDPVKRDSFNEVGANLPNRTRPPKIKIHFNFENVQDGIADIVVSRTYVDVSLPDSSYFGFSVYADAGLPDDPSVWIVEGGRRIDADIVENFVPHGTVKNVYRCSASFPASLGDRLLTLKSRYRWKAAGLLSSSAVTGLLATGVTQVYSRYLYSLGLEHVFVKCPMLFVPSTIEISASLPSEFAVVSEACPAAVFFQSELDDEPVRHESSASEIFMGDRVTYSMVVEDPTPGCRYFLAWPVTGGSWFENG